MSKKVKGLKYRKLSRVRAARISAGSLFKIGGRMYYVDTKRIYQHDNSGDVEIYAKRDDDSSDHTVQLVMDPEEKFMLYRYDR